MRYAPDIDFPPYAFLPGRDPHPVRDPRGHSYTEEEERAPEHLEAAKWRENSPYLYGVDLYNHGYLWEAHEAWESIWHPAKHDALHADFLQGLIQCAAACLKVAMDQPRGVAKLSELGILKLERVALEAGPEFMGVDLASFIPKMRSFAGSEPDSAELRPRLELRL